MMDIPKVSICILTLDRYWLTQYTMEVSIAHAGHDNIEILILDNGSADERIINWGKKFATKHFQEPINIGVSQGYNKLLKESTGYYIVTISNDMILSPGWLANMIKYNRLILTSGITAVHCLLDKGEKQPSGIFIPKSGLVYSNWLWSREVLNRVGGFNPKYTYGCEDSEYCFRAIQLGYTNYYIPDTYCTHAGEDYMERDDYRKMKDSHLDIATSRLAKEVERMREENNYYIPL